MVARILGGTKTGPSVRMTWSFDPDYLVLATGFSPNSFVPGPSAGARCGRSRSVRRGVAPRIPAAGQRADHGAAPRGRRRHRAGVRERD